MNKTSEDIEIQTTVAFRMTGIKPNAPGGYEARCKIYDTQGLGDRVDFYIMLKLEQSKHVIL